MKLSDVLQAEKLDFAGAANYIEAITATLKGKRTESEWKKVWEEATSSSMATSLSISLEPPARRARRLPSRLRDTIVTAETLGNRTVPIEEYRTQLYYAALDEIVGEMERRFDDTNISLLKAMQSLSPRSKQFLDYNTLTPFLEHYGIPPEEVETELFTAHEMLESCGSDRTLKNLHDIYDELSTVPLGFPQLLKCLQIAMSFGITSAAAERSFSSLRRMKTYLRSTMSQERLSNLALLYIERELSSTLWDSMDDVLQTFAGSHGNSRIILL